MPRKKHKYRHFQARNLAFVEINRQRTYLGKFNSDESWEKYHRMMADLAGGITLEPAPEKASVSVNALFLLFDDYAVNRYRKNGQPTSEVRSYRAAMKIVRSLYGSTLAKDFGPVALDKCRRKMIDAGWVRKRINQQVCRVRRIFKWGVSKEVVDSDVWVRLRSLEGLAKGEVFDNPKIRRATVKQVKAVTPYLTPPVRAMMELQLVTGCRPGEACSIRGCDLKMTGKTWEYRPGSHKTEHHDIERVVYLGPKAQAIIRPWLRTNLQEPLFSPQDGRASYLASVRKDGEPRRSNGKRCATMAYTTNAYSRAISKAASRHDRDERKRAAKEHREPGFLIVHLRPNQFRKLAATRIRRAYGLDMARIILGHQSVKTTEIYAERDRRKAARIMHKIG